MNLSQKQENGDIYYYQDEPEDNNNFIKYQDEYEMFIFIADLHSLTLPIDPKELRQNTKDLIFLRKIYNERRGK